MSDIHRNFVCALTDLGVSDPQSYTTWKLKERRQNYLDRKLCFIYRSGLSDIICSSVMTVRDALKNAQELEDAILRKKM